MFGCGGDTQKIPVAPIAENNMFFIEDHTVYLSTNHTINIPDIEAKKYSIQKDKNLVLLNISVIDNKNMVSAKVKIDVVASNLLGQNKEIKMLEIIENNSVSYAFLTSVSNLETLNYKIKVTLNEGNSKNLKYTHKFYTD